MEIEKSKRIKRLHRKLSGKHVVWFQETNQWVAFEKPAYKVFKWISKGDSLEKTSQKIAGKYDLEKKEALQFVSEINKNLKKITSESKEQVKISPDKKRAENTKRISHFYSINKQNLLVEYTHEKLAYYLHAPIKHYEVKKSQTACLKLRISVSENDFKIYRFDSEIGRYNNLTQLKHAFTSQLMFAAYGIEADEWCAWIHSSGVTNGQKTAIFVSSSGSGKSTMAAILQSRGFSVISDDVVYLKQSDMLCYPVPGALSVKDGATNTVAKYLPTFKPEKLDVFEIADKKIRFLPPEKGSKLVDPHAVSYIIFINYNPDSNCTVKKLSDYNAFSRFHQQAIINDSEESATTFINWFEELSYYELEYSNTDKALGAIEALFKDNP